MRITHPTALGATLLAFSCAVAPPAFASAALTAAKACRSAVTQKGKAYANARRRLLLSCADKLLKCALQLEVDGTNPSTCRSNAITACTTKLGSATDSSLNKAKTHFHDGTALACAPLTVTSMCSTAAGGLWYRNDPVCGSTNAATCGASADLANLVDCLRDRIDADVDQDVGRVMPRAGLLLDNAGLGASFADLPRPPTTDEVISASPANSGTLVAPGSPAGTITVPAGNAVTFTGDAVSLPCGGGIGMSGKVDIFVSTAADPCSDASAQHQTIKEPYGTGDAATFGPYDADQNVCIKLKDTSCTGSTTALIDMPADSAPPATASATLRACETRLETKVKALARFTQNKLHSCAEKVIKCKLASEIDGTDPTACLSSATTACMKIPTAISDKLTAFDDNINLKSKCPLAAFTDLQPFVAGLGFENVAASCSGKATLADLVDCILGVTGAGGTFGTKCDIEHKVFIRDPRALDSLTAAGLSPATDFPCLGP